MDIFYFVLFAAVGLFNILAAVLDFRWYVDYWAGKNSAGKSAEKQRKKWRVLLCMAGVLLIGFGAAVLAGLI